MGKTKVVHQPFYPGGRPQQEAITYTALLQEALLPALYQIYTPELEPLIRSRVQATINEYARELGILPSQPLPSRYKRTRPTTSDYIKQLYTTPSQSIPQPLLQPITAPSGEQILERLRGIATTTLSPLEQAVGRAEALTREQEAILRQLATQPMDNPYTQAVIQSLQRKMTEETARGLERLGTAFQLAGLSQSSVFPEQARLLAERGLQELQENISKLMFDIFERQRQTQLQALRMLSELPAQEIAFGELRSRIAGAPFNILYEALGRVAEVQSGVQQGAGVTPIVKQSPLDVVMQGIGAITGGLLLGRMLGNVFGGRTLLSGIT